MSRALLQVFVGLLIAAIPLIGLARRWNVPYPIVLVIGGLVLGFVPGLPPVALNPDLVLLIFLPPLLYWESITAPTDEMKANAPRVLPLAIGLVLATIAAVAAVAHALIPGMSWAVATVFGAVVAPTDEIASVPIAQRIGVPRRTTAIIDGESLLNDASSLVVYVTAVGAVVAGRFSLTNALAEFVLAALGAFAIGLIAGKLAVEAWRRTDDTRLEAVISVLLPFVTYVTAEQLQVSGVLAVVTAGVYVNHYTPIVITPAARVQMIGWWETTSLLINIVIFIVVGMQLHGVTAMALAGHEGWGTLLLHALAINATLIVVRFAWVFAQGAIVRMVRRSRGEDTDWRLLLVTAFAGFRGVVSLAAALAIPLTVAGGRPFPERGVIAFLTFSVILVTLVGGGLTMPALIRALRIPPENVEIAEEREALRETARAALERLGELERADLVDRDFAAYLRLRYTMRLERYAVSEGPRAKALDEQAQHRLAIERELLEAQRQKLVELRRAGRLENQVMRRVQITLDLMEAELQRTFNAGEALEESSELATRGLPDDPRLHAVGRGRPRA